MTKDEYIAKYGIEKYERRKAINREQTKKRAWEKGCKPREKEMSKAPSERLKTLMVETATGDIPNLGYTDPTQISHEVQKLIDAALRKWLKKVRERCPFKTIITADGICNNRKKIIIYTFEAVLLRPYTEEQREWFREAVKEFDTEIWKG